MGLAISNFLSATVGLGDSGPWYFETDLSRTIVEPWNAFSSLTFLIPVFYLLWQLRGRYREYAFLIFWAAPLMALGGIGSTIYHAFRASNFFLFMDFVPIALLTLSVSIYLWLKILPHKAWLILVITLFALMRWLTFMLFEGSGRINSGYFVTGLMIFLPAIIFLIKTNFYKIYLPVSSVLFLVLALFFRYADDYSQPLLPNGTHWLWHVCTSAGAFALAIWLVHIRHAAGRRTRGAGRGAKCVGGYTNGF